LLKGQRRASKAVKIGYFSQDQLDELHAGETPLDHIRDLAPNLSPAQHRSIAAQMGFGHEKIQTPVEKLSGGEKVRLLLGLMAYTKPHVLILDEPTSHLDIDSREALIHALNDYNGAVLLITHDVYLAEACADRLWLVHNGRAKQYDGDLSDYRTLVLSADRPATSGAAKGLSTKPLPAAAGNEPKRASLSTLKHKVEELEKEMDTFQRDISRIDLAIAAPGLFERDPARGAALGKDRAALTQHLQQAEERWLEASEALEAAKRGA
jgi:ATP-binding cassette subfamily F protein 3